MPRKLLAAVAALLVAGCDWYYNTLPSPDDLMAAVPWFDHMIKSTAVHPYQRSDVPRTTVPGTVPVTGNEPNDSVLFKSGNASLADRLVNPTVAAATLAKGDTLYQTFCSVCHGQTGAGDGLVRVNAPSLLTALAQGRSDGYLYSIIRYGRGVMPRYGDKVYLRDDRWAIVNYVRKLQRDAVVVPSSPTVGGGGR